VLTPWAPAASTFKLVTAAALLESDKASPTTRVCYHGGLQGITDDLLQDSPSLDTECSTLSNAVADSLNVVIAKLARRHLEAQELGDMARRLLFQTEIPFEFRVEPSPAHMPDDAIARAKVAAGFWHADMSPLHGALLASIVARGGVYQPPHVVSQVLGPGDSDRSAELPAPTRAIGRDVADRLAAMMLETTTGGTARNSFRDENGKDFVPGVAVAGKTGSLTGKRSPQLNYNWFIGFAPAESPEIAFAILLANDAKWRIKAHYAARRLIQLYVERRGAIREQREVRLTADGLLAPGKPERASTTIAAAPRPAEAPSPPSPAPDVLPPVPGPLPKG
jgi:cell division protein FtsI/penicillin-binding protein 2